MDALLLSKCDFLLKAASAVAEFAIWLNLALHEAHVDLQWEDRFRSQVGAAPACRSRLIAAAVIAAAVIAAAWRLDRSWSRIEQYRRSSTDVALMQFLMPHGCHTDAALMYTDATTIWSVLLMHRRESC